MRSIAGGIDGLEAVFDDASLVGDAGLLLAGTVMGRLGLESLIDETVRLDGRVAGSGSGRKVLTLVASMLVGGCCIDDAGRLRAGASQAVLPFRVMAPSTVGSFVRSFTFGHVRQLDRRHRGRGLSAPRPTTSCAPRDANRAPQPPRPQSRSGCAGP